MLTIFSPEQIRKIQTDELSEIKGMSCEEIAARIDGMQSDSREIMLRMNKSSEELHRRLAEKNSEELESLIERVPQAESTLRNRQGYAPKPKRPSFEDRVKANAKKASRLDPAVRAMLEELKAK
jgi:DNA-binding transcriptional MerR regulator